MDEQNFNNYGNDEKDTIKKLIEKSNAQTLANLILTIIIIILVIGYLNIETTVKVEMPPKFISENTNDVNFEITNSKATKNHYKVWGYYHINETATFKSKEIQKKIALIKKAYDQERLKKERNVVDEKTGKEYITTDNKELDEFVKNIRREKVKQDFKPTLVHEPILLYDNTEASLRVDGLANQIFEKMPKDPITVDKPCYYEIKLKREGGNTNVIGYKTNCFD